MKRFYRFAPSINKERLTPLCKVVDNVLRLGQGIVAIMEGQKVHNCTFIADVLKTMRWKCRIASLHYNERQWQDLVRAGSLSKKRTNTQGFGTMALAETLYICYNDKVPKAHEETRKFINPGMSVAANAWRDIAVSTEEDLAVVSMHDRMQVLADSSADLVDQDSFSDSDMADAEGEPVERPVCTKRGRGLTRQPSTPGVPLFSHPTAPPILLELIHIFNPQWLCIGTPGGGLSVKSGCRVGHSSVCFCPQRVSCAAS